MCQILGQPLYKSSHKLFNVMRRLLFPFLQRRKLWVREVNWLRRVNRAGNARAGYRGRGRGRGICLHSSYLIPCLPGHEDPVRVPRASPPLPAQLWSVLLSSPSPLSSQWPCSLNCGPELLPHSIQDSAVKLSILDLIPVFCWFCGSLR